MATRFGLASTVRAWGAAERSKAGTEKTPDPLSLGEEAWLSPHTARVGRAQLFHACSASKEDCQALCLYPPALPRGPPGSVMRQGSSSSASRFSERTFCSLAIWRTVLPDL